MIYSSLTPYRRFRAHKHLLRPAVAALLTAFAAQAASAATIYWDGTGTGWNIAANWSTSSSATTPNPVAVPASADIAWFNISTVNSSQTVSLNQSQIPLGIVFASTGGTTINNGTGSNVLNLGASGIVATSDSGPDTISATIFLSTDQNWTNFSSSQLAITGPVATLFNTLTVGGTGPTLISGIISNGGGITTADSATVTINGNNIAYTGLTTVGGTSTLVLGSATALGDVAGGTVVNSGATLDLNGQSIGAEPLTLAGAGVGANGALINSSGSAVSLSGPINAGTSASFTVGGTGNITLSGAINGISGSSILTKVGTANLTLSGTTDNAGLGLILQNGNVFLNKSTPGAHAIGSGGFTLNAGTLQITGTTGDQIADTANGTVASGAVFDLNGNSETLGSLNLQGGGVAVGSGALINSNAAAVTLTGNINITQANDFSVGGAGDITLNGSIGAVSGSSTLTKNGTNTLTLTGISTNQTLALIVQSGTVILAKSNPAVGAHSLGPGGFTLNGGKLQLAGVGGDQIDDTANGVVNSGTTFDLNGITETLNSLTIQGTGLVVVGSPIGALLNSSATAAILTANFNPSLSGAFTVTGTGDITINGGFNATSGSSTLTKIGTNTLTLGGTADNTGLALIVNAGTVILNKTAPGVHAVGSGGFTVNAGTLQFAGTNGDQVPDAANGTIASGATLDLGGTTETFNQLGILGTGVGGNGALINSAPVPATLTASLFAGVIGAFSVGGSGDITLNGAILASPTLTKIGTNTLTLAGTTDNSGITLLVNSGTVALGKASSASVHAAASFTANNGGTLQLAGTGADQIPDSATVTLNVGGTFDLNGRTETFNALNVLGTGVGGNGALINSAAAPATLTAGLNAGAGAFSVGGSGSITLNGSISGTPTLTKTGNNTLTLAGTTDGSGTTLVVNSGTVALGKASSASVHAAGTFTVNGGTLQLAGTGGDQIPDSASIAISGTGTLDLNGRNETFSTLNLPPNGQESLINSSTAPAVFTANVLNLNDAGPTGSIIGGTGDITFMGSVSAILFAQTLRKSGPDTLKFSGTTDNQNLKFSVPSGTLILAKTSSATVHAGQSFTLSGSGTVIIAGTGGDQIADSGSVQIFASGTLDFNGGSEFFPNLGTHAGILTNSSSSPAFFAGTINGAGNGQGDSTVTGVGDITLSGGISPFPAATNLTKTGANTLTLSGTADNTGLSIVVQSGKVVLAKTSSANVHAIGASGFTVNGGTLQIAGAGGDQINDAAAGTVNGGTLDFNGNSEVFSSLSLVNAANLINSNATAISFPGSINPATQGSFSVSGAGKITLSGGFNNLSNGTSLIMAGTNTLTLTGTADNTFLSITQQSGTIVLAKTSSASVHAAAGLNITSGTAQLAGTGGDQIENSTTVSVSGTGTFDVNGRNETFFSLSLQGTGSGNGALLNSASAASQLSLPGGTALTGDTTIGVTQAAASLTLNDPISGSASLSNAGAGTLILGGANTFTGDLNVYSGTVVLNGSLASANLSNYSTLIINAAQTITGRLTNFFAITLNGDLTAYNGLENDTFLTIPAGRTVTLYGQGLSNTGFLTVSGALAVSGYIGDSTNSGFMTLSNAFPLLFNISTLQNTGSLNLNSGLVYGSGSISNSGTLTGPGYIQIGFANAASGSVQPNGTLNITAPWVNAGLIQLSGAASAIQGGTITNSGSIQGTGVLYAPVANTTGTIDPSGAISIAGALTNATTGTLRVSAGNKILILAGGSFSTNAGLITLAGGTFDTGAQTLSNTGQITGYGILATGGLTNNGAITLTGGTTTVNGPVTNALGKTINIKYQPAIFTGNVTNSGTFKMTSTTATFTGGFSNSGSFISDPSTNIFQSTTTNAPTGSMSGGLGDVFNFSSGSFANAGTFNNGGTLQSNISISNSGTFTQSGPQIWSPNSTFTNSAGSATFSTDPGTSATRNLSLAITGGTVKLTGPQHLQALALSGTGKLDVSGDILLSPATPFSTLAAEISSGSIFTSTPITGAVVALLTAAQYDSLVPSALRHGQTLLSTDSLLTVAYGGDSDLNGIINIDDYLTIDSAFVHHLTNTTWLNGDSNANGTIDAFDYAAIDTAYLFQSGPLADGEIALHNGQFGQPYIDAFNGLTSPIPEPASLLLLLLSAPLLLKRRHPHHK